MRTSFPLRQAGKTAALAALLTVLITGCASYSGSGLVPGRSTAAEVEALMGPAAEKIDVAGGDKIWFYPRGPAGRQTFAARIGPDGMLRDIEPRLTAANRARLTVGNMRVQDVRTLLGPPNQTFRFPRIERDFWEYRMTEGDNQTTSLKTLSLEFSYDGVLRGSYFYDDPNDRSGACITC